MTLKWVYAAMVIAAALVLGFTLQDGRPAREVANSQRVPEPRVLGGGRADLPLPAPGEMPRPDVTSEAEPAAEAEAEAPGDVLSAEQTRQIAVQRPPAQRSALEASGGGAVEQRAMRGTGGGGGIGGGGAPAAGTAAAPFVPQAVFEAPPEQPAAAEIPAPVASAPVPPSEPTLPDDLPPDQRDALMPLLQKQHDAKVETAQGLVGTRARAD
jgi:hypothetical protein